MEINSKPPYEPPTVEDVPLHPEEVVLASCKTFDNPNTSGNGTSGGHSCFNCMSAGVS